MLNNTTFTNATNSTNGTGAGAGPQPPPFPQVDVVAMVFFCILALMIVFGNSLVIGAFRVNRRLRKTSNLLLVSLAIADMLIGMTSVPLWVYSSITYNYKGPLSDFYKIFDVICGVSSILNLTAISLERCYALLCCTKLIRVLSVILKKQTETETKTRLFTLPNFYGRTMFLETRWCPQLFKLSTPNGI